MSDIKLTPRLKCIADLVENNAILCDIGTDHGHLPLYLIQNKTINQALACDINEGPLSSALENAKIVGLDAKMDFRLTPGLENIKPHECDTISIAGMGGETISIILQDAKWTQDGKHKLILQPMTRISDLREFLCENNYIIENEYLCKEDHRFYIVIVACGNKNLGTVANDELEYYIPKKLCKDKLANEYLTKFKSTETRVLDGLLSAKNHNQAQIEHQKKLINYIDKLMEDVKK